jgi:membrane protein implicated in regulation of membrane protease activity
MKLRGEWGTWVWLEWAYLVLGAVIVIWAVVALLTDPAPAWTWWVQGVMGIIFVTSAVQLLRRPRHSKTSPPERSDTDSR